MYPQFSHYGVEFYSAGTLGSSVQCSGERDPACSAGDGAVSVDLQHFSNYGVEEGEAGCGGGIPSTTI